MPSKDKALADSGSGSDTIGGPAKQDDLQPMAAQDDERPPPPLHAGVDDLGLDPAKVAADDPARTGVPRDEREDSIDPHTGTLTEEAQRLRAERLAREREG